MKSFSLDGEDSGFYGSDVARIQPFVFIRVASWIVSFWPLTIHEFTKDLKSSELRKSYDVSVPL
jgi:hypothetical protein